MNVSKLVLIGSIAIGIMACTKQASNEENTETNTNGSGIEKTYTVDIANSEVAWSGKMLGIKEHSGIIKMSEGSISTNGGVVTGGLFTIDWNSMVATDSNYNEEYTAEKLVAHLKSADFFASDSLGAANFKITGMEGNDIVGEMTIRGITNTEKVTDVTISESDGGINASGNLTFDRQKYGVAYSTGAADMVISDDISLNIAISGKTASN